MLKVRRTQSDSINYSAGSSIPEQDPIDRNQNTIIQITHRYSSILYLLAQAGVLVVFTNGFLFKEE
jgi:hypothetical protein